MLQRGVRAAGRADARRVLVLGRGQRARVCARAGRAAVRGAAGASEAPARLVGPGRHPAPHGPLSILRGPTLLLFRSVETILFVSCCVVS